MGHVFFLLRMLSVGISCLAVFFFLKTHKMNTFLLQGNHANTWMIPLPWQRDLIQQTYTSWRNSCGQGGSPTPTTISPIHEQRMDPNTTWTYQVVINGEGSFLENTTFQTKRKIHFLPLHPGR